MAEYDSLVRELREYSSEASNVADVVGWLHRRLTALQGENLSAYTFVYCLFKAFDLEFYTAQRVQGWAALGWGGDLSDEGLEQLLGRLVPRSDEMVDP